MDFDGFDWKTHCARYGEELMQLYSRVYWAFDGLYETGSTAAAEGLGLAQSSVHRTMRPDLATKPATFRNRLIKMAERFDAVWGVPFDYLVEEKGDEPDYDVIKQQGPTQVVSARKKDKLDEPRTPGLVVESNADLVELGTAALWLPLYPAFLGAGQVGAAPTDVIPDGAVPIPESFARAQGLTAGPTFAAHVRGDSMRDDFGDGDLVFGTVQEDYDREAVYALYLAGELLVKRVVRRLHGFELVSTNRAYAPIPITTDDVRLIGRVVGAISRV